MIATGELRKVPDLIQEYAQTYYEWHLRSGSFRVFSHRQKFDAMTDDDVCKELDRLRAEVIERYAIAEAGLAPAGGTLTSEERPTVVNDYGDYVILRCACGAEVGFSPPGDDRERSCACGRVLWLTQSIEYGYHRGDD